MPIETANQLAEDIRGKIERGEIRPGERLAPIRAIAQEVGLNRNTVAAAYQKLQGFGLVEQAGRNLRVAMRPIIHDEEFTRHSYPGVADLSFNNPDPALLPDVGALLRMLDLGASRLYGDTPDEPDLTTQFSRQHAVLGLPAGAVMITAGITDSMARLLQLYLRFGDKIAVEDPCYMKLLHLVRAGGFSALPLALDHEGVQEGSLDAALRAGAKAVFVTPRGQNPTGASISPERAARLRTVLARYPDVLVVEDEHGGPLLDGPAHSLIDPDREHWAVLHSAAKYVGPDMRVGAAIGSDRTIGRLRSQRALGG